MIDLITDNLEAIKQLCRTHGIRRLDLFGSAASGTFDPESSDVDFVVDLGGYERGVARRFGRFARALETLLGYPVEVLTDEELQGTFLGQSIAEHRVCLYEAGDRVAAA